MNDKIKKWREEQGLTPTEAAELLKCSKSQLSEVESGKNFFSRKKIQEIIDNVPSLTVDHFFNSPNAN